MQRLIGRAQAQSRLKEAFKRARSIAQSTGKGRVDELGGARPKR